MAEFQTGVVPYVQKGVNLDQDPADLGQDEFQELTNLVSVQEGSIGTRNGHQRLTGQNAFSGHNVSLIHSVSKLTLSDSDAANKYYVGEGESIFRANGPLPATGASMTFASVATGAADPLETNYTKQRFTSARYGAGTIGTPWEFFACPKKMLKDNGSAASLETWGIFPPARPATTSLGPVLLLPGYDIAGSALGASPNRLPVGTTVASFTGTSPGALTVTPSSMTGIISGMLLRINATQYAFVSSTSADTFTGYFETDPAPGDAIDAFRLPETAPTNSVTIPVAIDASFNATAANGYSSEDVLHVGVYVDDPSLVTDIRIRVLVHGSASDYYEKSILPSSLQGQASLIQTAFSSLDTRTTQVDQSIVGQSDISDPTTQTAKPAELGLISPEAATNAVWTEVDIPKDQFIPVGLAGQGAYTWKDVTGIAMVYAYSSGTPTVALSSIYFAGGYGPNAAGSIFTAPLAPYDYRYCVTSDTPVLCEDLSWRPAGELEEGQGIIAFDEHETLGVGRRATRRYKKAKIVCNAPEDKECCEIRTDIGDPVRATLDHPWLVWDEKRKINGHSWSGLSWKTTEELVPGDKIAHFSRPWSEDTSRDGGWLAGMFDGEGCIRRGAVEDKAPRWNPWAVCISQKAGVVLDKIRQELNARGIKCYENTKASGGVVGITVTGTRAAMRLLGQLRPVRLLPKLQNFDFLPGLRSGVTYELAEVTSISKIGVQRVASIQTSCGTFITGGYLSHNTYRNPSTGQESNPSIGMVALTSPHRQKVTVTVLGTSDPQIPTTANATSISVYRQGGAFADGFYRRVGYATNPGFGLTVDFNDNQSDTDLVDSDVLEFDNDPPVLATLPVPLRLGFVGYVDGIGLPGGYNTFTVNIISGPSLTSLDGVLKIGNTLTIGVGSDTQEQVIIYNVAGLVIEAWFQKDHQVTDAMTSGAVFCSADSVSGHAANLACSAMDSIFVAGDTYNPHILYQSKVGRPESFPVIEEASGIARQIPVGSPSNPIKGITDFNGEVVSLNLTGIYTVRIFGGQMQAATRSPAQRGCVGTYAWCKADNEIWYLSYDGIYSWAGGASQKRSQKIDPLFKGVTVGNYAPIDMSRTDIITFSYYKNSVIVTYKDTLGVYNRLTYDMIFDRWLPSVLADQYSGILAVTGQYVTEDTGQLLIAKSITLTDPVNLTTAYLYLDDTGTSDGWVGGPTDGANIAFAMNGPTFTANAPSANKQFSDFILELANDQTIVTVQAFYDFMAGDAMDVFLLGAASGGELPTSNDGYGTFSSVAPGTDFSISALTPGYGTISASAGMSASGSGYGVFASVIQSQTLTLGRHRETRALQDGFGKEAYAISLRITGSSNHQTTFYSITHNFLMLQQIQGGRAYDWDDLGWPADKRLSEVTLEYDIPDGYTMNLNVDGMSGITGSQTITQAEQVIRLTRALGTYIGPRRIKTTFPIDDGIVVKQVRVRPDSTTTPFKLWGYSFQFEKLPPDKILFTPWNDFGYKCEKIARNLMLDIDTGGMPAHIQLQVDGATVQTFAVTTSLNDRIRILACQSNLIGRMWRLVLAPGNAGKAQLYDWQLSFVKEPCAVTHIDTYEQELSYVGWKWLKDCWVTYQSDAAILLSVTRDGGQIFYSVALPKHPYRDKEFFYFPASHNGVLNKSKRYRIQVDSFSPFKLYPESAIEYMPIGSDQRQAFLQWDFGASQQFPGVE